MKTMDICGKSVSEILSQFAREKKINLDEIQYEVIDNGSPGFLGLGRRPARVRILFSSVKERVSNFVEQLLHKLDLGFSEVRCKTEGKAVYVDIIEPSDPGFLIGKNGSILETLQFLVNRIFESSRDIERIYLDTENYRHRREKAFLNPYLPQFKQVKTTGKALTMEPMPAPQRRIIHRYIESDPFLRTLTVGEGDNKRIVVFSANQNEKEALPKANPANKSGKPRPPRLNRSDQPAKPPKRKDV